MAAGRCLCLCRSSIRAESHGRGESDEATWLPLRRAAQRCACSTVNAPFASPPLFLIDFGLSISHILLEQSVSIICAVFTVLSLKNGSV